MHCACGSCCHARNAAAGHGEVAMQAVRPPAGASAGQQSTLSCSTLSIYTHTYSAASSVNSATAAVAAAWRLVGSATQQWHQQRHC
jgi:hypothetical protein